MKYLFAILLMPVLCQAMMTAKEANTKTQRVVAAQSKDRDRDFLSRVEGDISDAVDGGQCNTSIMAIDVSAKVIDTESKALSKLGYTIKNDSQFLTIEWCR